MFDRKRSAVGVDPHPILLLVYEHPGSVDRDERLPRNNVENKAHRDRRLRPNQPRPDDSFSWGALFGWSYGSFCGFLVGHAFDRVARHQLRVLLPRARLKSTEPSRPSTQSCMFFPCFLRRLRSSRSCRRRSDPGNLRFVGPSRPSSTRCSTSFPSPLVAERLVFRYTLSRRRLRCLIFAVLPIVAVK